MIEPMAHDSDALTKLRFVGDAEADAVIADFVGAVGIDDPRNLMLRLVRRRDLDASIDGGPSSLRRYLGAGLDALPEWRDDTSIRRGQQFFEDAGLAIATALFCASLPTAYLSSQGARVIAITGELVSTPQRRVAETAQLLASVMDLGDTDDGQPLGPATRGFHGARGVRLMHAAVRAFITLDAEASQRYDVESLGIPINQEDLLGTLLTFTVVVFDALERMGIAVDPADADAYLHTWCVIGHLLGIRPDLLPLDMEAARELDRRIRSRQQRPSAEGVALMDALRSEMRTHMPRLLRRFPDALVYEFIGSDAARGLNVPDPGPSRVLVEIMQRGGWIWSRAPGRAARNWLSRVLARRMIRSYIDEGRGDRPAWDYTRYVERWKLERLRTRTVRSIRRRRSG